jgi:N-acetylglucosaminyl-diphospho-decaprenol L-rhamnosyltransferase
VSTLPPVAVVVVSYGSSELLATNLAAVATECPDARVVVVDNYSSDAELVAVRRLCADHGWRLVANATNVGFGTAMNAGVATALADGAEQLLLLNPDATISRASLTRLREVVATAPLTLAAPVIETPDGGLWSDGHDLYLDRGRMRATRRREGAPRVAPWLSGACLLISAELWGRVGGFDDRYFLYWEDVDLSWRVVEAGGSLQVVRDAVAEHDEGGTQERLSRRALSTTYYYYNIRNRLVFAAHHLPRADRWRWVLTAVPEAYQILLRGGRRQLVASTGPWRAAITGTVSGLVSMYRHPSPRRSPDGR